MGTSERPVRSLAIDHLGFSDRLYAVSKQRKTLPRMGEYALVVG